MVERGIAGMLEVRRYSTQGAAVSEAFSQTLNMR
jgi:hypothetical protein